MFELLKRFWNEDLDKEIEMVERKEMLYPENSPKRFLKNELGRDYHN